MYTDRLMNRVFHGFKSVHVGALCVGCGAVSTTLFGNRLALLWVSVLAENTMVLVDGFECLFSHGCICMYRRTTHPHARKTAETHGTNTIKMLTSCHHLNGSRLASRLINSLTLGNPIYPNPNRVSSFSGSTNMNIRNMSMSHNDRANIWPFVYMYTYEHFLMLNC
jgi:hypothetical protein